MGKNRRINATFPAQCSTWEPSPKKAISYLPIIRDAPDVYIIFVLRRVLIPLYINTISHNFLPRSRNNITSKYVIFFSLFFYIAMTRVIDEKRRQYYYNNNNIGTVPFTIFTRAIKVHTNESYYKFYTIHACIS